MYLTNLDTGAHYDATIADGSGLTIRQRINDDVRMVADQFNIYNKLWVWM